MQKKSYVVLFTFILKNKLTIILIVLLVFLFKQNILGNNFPSVVIKKQKNIESIEITNFNLLNDKQNLKQKIKDIEENTNQENTNEENTPLSK